LGGPDVLASGCGGVVLETPTVVFVGWIGLAERVGKGDQDIARGETVDGVGGDGDLGDDQAIGSGRSDGRTRYIAGGSLAASGRLAASDGIERSSGRAGDIVKEEGGTTGGTASHGEGDGEGGAGDGISGVEGLHIAGGGTVVESGTDLGMSVAVAIGNAGDIEIRAVIGSGDDEITGAGELQRDSAALTGGDGFLLHVNNADASRRRGTGSGGLEGHSDGVPAIGRADFESGSNGAVRGLD